mgnify:CR=1 FL=1
MDQRNKQKNTKNPHGKNLHFLENFLVNMIMYMNSECYFFLKEKLITSTLPKL